MMKIRKSKVPPFRFWLFLPVFGGGPLLIKSTPYDHVLTNSFWKSSFWEQNKSHFALPEAIPWFGPEILQVSKKSKDLTSIQSNLVKMTWATWASPKLVMFELKMNRVNQYARRRSSGSIRVNLVLFELKWTGSILQNRRSTFSHDERLERVPNWSGLSSKWTR